MKVSEKLVVQLWQYLLSRERQMRAVSGEMITIVSGGEESDDSGPDFTQVVIFVDSNGPITGDVEIHVNSSDWCSHGHHRDTSYNTTVLHVVMWHDATSTLLENGVAIPVIALAQYLGKSPNEIYHLLNSRKVIPKPCQNKDGHSEKEYLGELLDTAGEKRFSAKADNFHEQMLREPVNEVLYQGIMDALGYTRNREAFRRLGYYRPVSHLRGISSVEDGTITIQAILLGTAGLLPSQRKRLITEKDSFLEKIESIWRTSGLSRAMEEREWRFFRVRPGNYPPRRIAAFSHLLTRYTAEGMLEYILHKTQSAADCRPLEDEFIVHAAGYWQYHYDYDVAGSLSTLLGRERSSEIIQNIVLPFMLAFARKEKLLLLQQSVWRLFRSYPLREGNRVTRLMEQRIPTDTTKVINTARRQQGLLHLYHNYCAEEKCVQCPLGRSSSVSL